MSDNKTVISLPSSTPGYPPIEIQVQGGRVEIRGAVEVLAFHPFVIHPGMSRPIPAPFACKEVVHELGAVILFDSDTHIITGIHTVAGDRSALPRVVLEPIGNNGKCVFRVSARSSKDGADISLGAVEAHKR